MFLLSYKRNINGAVRDQTAAKGLKNEPNEYANGTVHAQFLHTGYEGERSKAHRTLNWIERHLKN